MYRLLLSRRAEKAFLGLPLGDARAMKEALEELQGDPRGHGTIKLENAPIAQYRRRVGSYRVLFDIDEDAKSLEILDIRRRSESTYR